MKISNADKFEEKLRKVESDLHIDPANRILVSYTRNRFEASFDLVCRLSYIPDSLSRVTWSATMFVFFV